MAKFDKNEKNEFLNDAELYDDYLDDDFEYDQDGYGETAEDADYDDVEGIEGAYDESEFFDEDLPLEYADSEGSEETGASSEYAEDDYDGNRRVSSRPHWYVIHTYSGHENKVKTNIEKIVENKGMQDLIQAVSIPTETVVDIKNGRRKERTHKLYPGYVIVKMIVTNESWYLVRNTQGVTGFVGHGTDPVPLTDEEVSRMGIDNMVYNVDIEVGDRVVLRSGPFDGYSGTVEEISPERQTISVNVSMFGRETPVRIDFGQVEKIQ